MRKPMKESDETTHIVIKDMTQNSVLRGYYTLTYMSKWWGQQRSREMFLLSEKMENCEGVWAKGMLKSMFAFSQESISIFM